MKHFINNLISLGIIGILIIIPLSADSAKNRNVKKPNILIIMADDLGYGDLSVMGGTDIQTPNIDQLFQDGLIFTEFYANSTVGSPTQASLLTGRYPGFVGVPGAIRSDETNSWGYFNCDSTLSTHFQNSGYTTAIIGKWDLGLKSPNLPNEKGFDLFMGFFENKMEKHNTQNENEINDMRFNEKGVDPPGHTTDLLSDWSADFIRRESEVEKPFFLYVSYNTSFPVEPPADWVEKINKRQPNLDLNRTKNIASIEHMDAGVGRIIDALNETNQLKNTIIIFSSDNGGYLPGGASNSILRGGKQDLYEGGIRVPTCLFWKEKVRKGSLCHQIAMTMDIYPTLCNLTETPNTLMMDGKDLSNCIYKGEPLPEERTLFWICREGGKYKGQAFYAVRQGAYKLMQNSPFEDFQLYNLTTDPHEQIPLSKNSVHYVRLQRILDQHIQENEKISWKEKSIGNDIIQSLHTN